MNRKLLLGMARAAAVIMLTSGAQLYLQRPDTSLIAGMSLFVVGAALLLWPQSKPLPILAQHPTAVMLAGTSLAGSGATLFLHTAPVFSPVVLLAPWIVSLVAFLLFCHHVDSSAGAASAPMINRWTRQDTLLLGSILGAALLLRVIALDRLPATMNGDEGAMGMEALRVIRGEITDPFGTGWLSHPTFWFFLQALSMQLLGDDLFGLRMLSAAIGTFTVGTTYVLARMLYTRRVAAIAAVLLATYHFHIHFSRMALNNIADPLIGSLVFIFLTAGIRSRRLLAYGLTGLVLGLGLYFYHGTRLFIPILLVAGTIRLQPWSVMRRGRLEPVHLSAVVAIVAGAALAAGPLLQRFVAHPDEFMARYTIEGVSREWLSSEAQRTGKHRATVIADQITSALLAFNRIPDRGPFYDNQRPLLWGLAGGLMIVGGIVALAHLRSWKYQIPIIWFALGVFFGGAMLQAPPKSPRYVTLAPVVCLFIAFAIERIARLAGRRQHLLSQLIASGIAVYLGTVSTLGYFREYLPREEIGGLNTRAANALALYLKDDTTEKKVWFLGAPRMYYHGLPLLDFLVRHVEASDVIDPVVRVHDVPPRRVDVPTVYVAIPERRSELDVIKRRFPDGIMHSLVWPSQPDILLYTYVVPATFPHQGR